MSDDPPGMNAPRRKSRFRSQYETDAYRRASATRRPTSPDPAASEPDLDPASPVETSDPAYAEDTTPGGSSPEDPSTSVQAATAGPRDELLPNFRLTKVYEARPPSRSPLKDWRWLLVTVSLLALGLAGGYWLGQSNTVSSTEPEVGKQHEAKQVTGGLSPELQARVDAAFAATKKIRYREASDMFAALRREHPEWWSMGIESARACLYLHDIPSAQSALKELNSNPAALPDSDFIMGLLHLTNKELELAEASFGLAVARDPARPDFYYFWGECLRRDGKPREAVDKFRAALLRNQYENSEGLYQIKLWLSQIQADQEEASGANREIDAALATPHPPYEALFAAAARELKAKRYPGAATFLTRAQTFTEPAVFRVIMQDPSFVEEAATHAELASFYH